MTAPSAGTAPDRLARRLGLGDSVVLGLGAMIGAGVFAAVGPAAEAAGAGLLIGLVLAALVAFCNATSSAQLAASHPVSGGTYVYGRERLGHFWGYLAGVAFIAGKLASLAAIALTFGSYVAPELAHPVAVAAVVVLTAVNYRGIEKTAALTRVLVAVVLAVLGAAVVGILAGGTLDAGRLAPATGEHGLFGVLESAGLLFFAFAGYARIATLGEEVVDPRRTIPRAIPIALAVTFVVYAAVAATVLLAIGPEAAAESEAPLAAAVSAAGGAAFLEPVVRAGAAVACAGVLLSLLAGVGRTTFAMAGAGDLPRPLAAAHPRYHVPHRAELAIGAVVAVAAATLDLRAAIGFSSFAVLLYYAITNASALRLAPHERHWPKPVAALGLLGCLALAFTLELAAIAVGCVLLALAAAIYGLRSISNQP